MGEQSSFGFLQPRLNESNVLLHSVHLIVSLHFYFSSTSTLFRRSSNVVLKTQPAPASSYRDLQEQQRLLSARTIGLQVDLSKQLKHLGVLLTLFPTEFSELIQNLRSEVGSKCTRSCHSIRDVLMELYLCCSGLEIRRPCGKNFYAKKFFMDSGTLCRLSNPGFLVFIGTLVEFLIPFPELVLK